MNIITLWLYRFMCWLERRHMRLRTIDNPSLLQLEECRRVLCRLTVEEHGNWDRRVLLADAAAMVKQISYRRIESDYMAPASDRPKVTFRWDDEEATHG